MIEPPAALLLAAPRHTQQPLKQAQHSVGGDYYDCSSILGGLQATTQSTMSSHQQHNDHGGSTTEFPSSLPPPPPPMMSPTGNSSEEENETSPPPPLPSIYRILVEFAYKHIDFQMAELASVLHAHAGIDLHNPAQCRLHPRHQTFVVLDLVGSTSQHNNSNHNHNNAPKRPSPSDNVLGQIGSILVSQCTLVRSVVELWGMGESVHHCIASTRDFVTKHPHSLQPYIQPPSSSSQNSPSWKLTVHSLGSSLSMSEQATIRSQFSFLGFTGKVILNNPDQEFVFLQEVPLQHNLVTTNSSSSSSSPSSLEGSSAAAVSDPANTAETSPPNSPLASAPDPLQPIACYFGRVLGGIRHTKGRANLNDYLLSKRAYLGPTSMDAELSLIMASLAQIQSGSIVYDPFVGTGSILVACALRGASHCIGSDLDVRVLRGKHRNQNVYTNFAQFQLPRPELIRTDNALYHRHYRHHLPLYHAIVCDPPYGIRAGARKCGSKLDQPRPISEEQRIDHIPQTRYVCQRQWVLGFAFCRLYLTRPSRTPVSCFADRIPCATSWPT